MSDYSITPTNRPLPQIEKIVSGMFNRKTNFEDLQSVVVDCIEQASSASLDGNRQTIEKWARDYQAYNNVMTLAPMADSLQKIDLQLTDSEASLGEIRGKFTALIDHMTMEISDGQVKSGHLTDASQQGEARFNEQNSRLSGQLTVARTEVGAG